MVVLRKLNSLHRNTEKSFKTLAEKLNRKLEGIFKKSNKSLSQKNTMSESKNAIEVNKSRTG
jgi:hypothetical protein